MNVEIFPIKKAPEIKTLGGDYYYTQSALFLGMMANGETVIKNCSKSVDTERTVKLIQSLGIDINIENDTINIKSDGKPQLPEGETLSFKGELFPLSLTIGLLAGLNKSCILHYSENINQDMIDRIIETFNLNGIDIFHEADSQTLVMRAATNLPVKTKVHSTNSCIKNSLIMFGVSSGVSVIIRETAPAAKFFEAVTGCFGVSLDINKPGSKLVEDPNDPRRKIRVAAADYRRELVIAPHTDVKPSEIIIPSDSDSVSSMATLAVLLKKEMTLDNVLINSARTSFLEHLKSIGCEVTVKNRKTESRFSTGSIILRSKKIKARKFAGEHTSVLIDDVPFMALMAVLGSGTTIIRGVNEFNEWGIRPFQEIADNFGRMGVKCGVLEDGLIIEGTGELNGADFGPFLNPKIALSFYITALAGQGVSTFSGFELIADYYPDIVKTMQGSARHRTILTEEV